MMDPEVLVDDQPKFPPVPLDLLMFLEQRYPERCWQPGDTDDESKFYGGKRDLVRHLRVQFEAQNAPPEDEEPTDVR